MPRTKRIEWTVVGAVKLSRHRDEKVELAVGDGKVHMELRFDGVTMTASELRELAALATAAADKLEETKA